MTAVYVLMYVLTDELKLCSASAVLIPMEFIACRTMYRMSA
jgi:hypothetical protein